MSFVNFAPCSIKITVGRVRAPGAGSEEAGGERTSNSREGSQRDARCRQRLGPVTVVCQAWFAPYVNDLRRLVRLSPPVELRQFALQDRGQAQSALGSSSRVGALALRPREAASRQEIYRSSRPSGSSCC